MQPVPSAAAQAFDPPLGELMADYEQSLRADRHSVRTIDWYLAFLRDFCSFAERPGESASLRHLSTPIVRRWLVALESRPRPPAPSSLAGRVRTLRAFAAWVQREYDLEQHPLRRLKTPRVPRTLIHSLRGADVDALLAAARQGSLGERDAALITFVLDTGVRVSEVASLRIGDVDFENAVCRVVGKGSKERRVPVGRLARRELRRYLARRRRPPGDAPLFMAEHGEPLTRWGIQKLVHRVAQRAGLQTRCSPHVLRHTFARAFLTNGGDVFALQRILGHSPASLNITQRYVELLDEDLREVHRRASPMDQWRSR